MPQCKTLSRLDNVHLPLLGCTCNMCFIQVLLSSSSYKVQLFLSTAVHNHTLNCMCVCLCVYVSMHISSVSMNVCACLYFYGCVCQSRVSEMALYCGSSKYVLSHGPRGSYTLISTSALMTVASLCTLSHGGINIYLALSKTVQAPSMQMY